MMAEQVKQTAQRFGGSFAPALTPEKIKEYRVAAEDAEPEVKGAILELCDMADAFLGKARSDLPGTPHPSERGLMIPLRKNVMEEIEPLVPWPWQCSAIQTLFNELPDGITERTEWIDAPKSLKNPNGEGKVAKVVNVVTDQKAYAIRQAAFHLLWYAKELTIDRQPMTKEEILHQEQG